jgi:hypothetical protein
MGVCPRACPRSDARGKGALESAHHLLRGGGDSIWWWMQSHLFALLYYEIPTLPTGKAQGAEDPSPGMPMDSLHINLRIRPTHTPRRQLSVAVAHLGAYPAAVVQK